MLITPTLYLDGDPRRAEAALALVQEFRLRGANGEALRWLRVRLKQSPDFVGGVRQLAKLVPKKQ